MAKIRASELIELFERMARENWRYEWGAAKERCVDCSGAFVYAYNALGGPAIEHGSNAIARKRVGELRGMDEARPGWAAFKVRPWTDAERSHRWHGTEPGNAYHIGLVGSDGRIYNAKDAQSGFVASDARGWTHCAPLLAVAEESERTEDMAIYTAVVTTERDPLRIRRSPVDGEVIGYAEKGEAVEVLSEGDWPRIRCDGVEGYVCGEYLTAREEEGEAEEVVIQIVIRDSEDNEFRPVGRCTVDFEVVAESID